ncbi:hypothetical protein ABIE91_003459 [Bradyrhizobium elkanii]
MADNKLGAPVEMTEEEHRINTEAYMADVKEF